MSQRRCVRVRVGGRVQGVFFRALCAREARLRGVAGWVRNLPDGDVEAVFEGGWPAVEAMVAWCREGPPGAAVDHVDLVDGSVEGLVGFEIRG